MKIISITNEDHDKHQITHHIKNVICVGFHCHLGKEVFQTEHHEVRI